VDAERALARISEAAGISDVADMRARLLDLTQAIDVPYFVCRFIQLARHAHIDNMPEEWHEHQTTLAATAAFRDPVVQHMITRSDVICWSGATYAAVEHAATYEAMQTVGISAGAALCMRGVNGARMYIGFCGPDFDVNVHRQSPLMTAAIFAAAAACLEFFSGHFARTERRASKELSGREVECLRWAYAGKTLLETSVILSISPNTVRDHILAATRKLGANNKVSAVSSALRAGYF
jgi:LuxR family transcriptional regulator, quorum-sensing system regulator BjaR1